MDTDIRIFVSHRIDIDSELVDNPVYVPIRCGAVFDRETPIRIAGDDTGDNISERRMSFCEFTVQYWAWKNAQADYYGLCHYRRFLSFAEHRFRTDEYNMVHVPLMTPKGKRRYGLLDHERMAALISGYDAVCSESADVRRIPTPVGKTSTVREMWEAQDGEFFEKAVIDRMFELIDRMAPAYSRSAREYFAQDMHRGFNCYVMKKELFDRLCAFQFPIMFELERTLDTTGYSQTMQRTPAFVGEMLYGIFMYHIITVEHRSVRELQLVFFADTDRIRNRGDLILRCAWAGFDQALRLIADPLLPKGSRRREFCKSIFYRVTRMKKHGVADIRQK